jgi:hypothetical protein
MECLDCLVHIRDGMNDERDNTKPRSLGILKHGIFVTQPAQLKNRSEFGEVSALPSFLFS